MDHGALIDKIRRRAQSHGFDMHEHGLPPKPDAPFDLSLRARIEVDLGFTLPDLLVDVLHQVGNGGFGPGYGLMGLGPDGFTDDMGHTVDTLYDAFRRDSESDPTLFRWPEGFLPLCHLGCALYDCLALDDDEIILWEPTLFEEGQDVRTAMFPYGLSLSEWLEHWAKGGQPLSLTERPPMVSCPKGT